MACFKAYYKYLEAGKIIQRHTGTLYYCNIVVSSLFLGIFVDFVNPTDLRLYKHFLLIQIVVMNFSLLK